MSGGMVADVAGYRADIINKPGRSAVWDWVIGWRHPRAAVGVDGATPSADAADIAISRKPGVPQM